MSNKKIKPPKILSPRAVNSFYSENNNFEMCLRRKQKLRKHAMCLVVGDKTDKE